MSNEILTEVKLDLDGIRADLKEAQEHSEKTAHEMGDKIGHSIEEGFKKPFEKVHEMFLEIAAAAAAAFTFEKAIEAASEMEQHVNALNAALAVHGNYSEEASEHALHLAHSLQETSIASADTIVKGEAMLVTLGRLKGEGLDRATKAALDMAAALNIDVNTAFNLVSKAANGHTATLGRYGVTVKATGDRVTDFEHALKAIETRFHGLAELQTGTFAGAMAQTKNKFTELLEAVGDIIIKSPTTIALIKTMGEAFEHAAQAITKWAAGRDIMKELGVALILVGNVVNTYLVAPFELAFNICRTGVLTIMTLFGGLVTVLQSIEIAIADYLVLPLTNFIGGVFGKFISLIDKDMGAAVQNFVNDTTNAISGGMHTVRDSIATTTADLAAQTAESAGKTFDFNVADATASYIAKADEFFAAVKPHVGDKFKEISDNAKETLPDGMWESFSNGFMEAAKKIAGSAEQISKTMHSLGAQIFNTIGTGTTNAFAAMGAAMAKGKNGMEAFGAAMLGVLGDIAIQFGATFIAMGVAKTLLFDPTGPLLIAAGGVLAAIGGALKATAGGASAAAGAASGGGGGVAAGPSAGVSPSSDNGQSYQNAQAAVSQTKIQLVVQGNVLDRRQTGIELVDILNESFGTNGVVLATGQA